MTHIILRTSGFTLSSGLSGLSAGAGKLMQGIRAAIASPAADKSADELPPRLRYDVGLMDVCEDRVPTGAGARKPSETSIEMMRLRAF